MDERQKACLSVMMLHSFLSLGRVRNILTLPTHNWIFYVLFPLLIPAQCFWFQFLSESASLVCNHRPLHWERLMHQIENEIAQLHTIGIWLSNSAFSKELLYLCNTFYNRRFKVVKYLFFDWEILDKYEEIKIVN